MRICCPIVDSAVTDCPDGAVSFTAGVNPVLDAVPTGAANTWNALALPAAHS
jgi:hypothetical protein